MGGTREESSLLPGQVRFRQVLGGAGPRLSSVVTSDPGSGTKKVFIQPAADAKLGGVATARKAEKTESDLDQLEKAALKRGTSTAGINVH